MYKFGFSDFIGLIPILEFYSVILDLLFIFKNLNMGTF